MKEQEIVTMNDFLVKKSVRKIRNQINQKFVYTDGACSNNGSENAKAGFGIFSDDPRNLSKKVKGKQTNNVAELSAIIEVSKF